MESCGRARLGSEREERSSIITYGSVPNLRCAAADVEVGLNLLLLFIPCAWVSHFENVAGHWPHRLTFACAHHDLVEDCELTCSSSRRINNFPSPLKALIMNLTQRKFQE